MLWHSFLFWDTPDAQWDSMQTPVSSMFFFFCVADVEGAVCEYVSSPWYTSQGHLRYHHSSPVKFSPTFASFVVHTHFSIDMWLIINIWSICFICWDWTTHWLIPPLIDPLILRVQQQGVDPYCMEEDIWLRSSQDSLWSMNKSTLLIRGIGRQEQTQNMRYNVPIHQSDFYLLYLVLEPSMNPPSTPGGRGQLLLSNVKCLTLFRS